VKRTAAFLLVFAAIGTVAVAAFLWKRGRAPAASTDARIDQIFAKWSRSDSPGCSLGVGRNGAVLYERGYGMASLELGVPITPAHVFPAASISKQFTAMSILLLAKGGQLSLDDDVAKHIPEWGDHGSRITIRHLLNHTSGLRDAFLLEGFAPPRDNGGDTNAGILKTLVRARGLNFQPGAEFQYNNGAYNLLGSIVKRVSGKSLREFADANIFRPLGMTHTHFHDDTSEVVANRVSGYHHDGRRYQVASENGGVVGNAGLQTTVGDLLIWEQNFADARVGDRALLDSMQTPAMETGWSEGSSYGFGVEIGKYRGQRTVAHGGGDRGIGTYVVRYPEQGLAIALLCNLDNVGENGGVTRLTQQVADIYLERALGPAAPANESAKPTQAALPAAQMAGMAGLYRDVSDDSVGRIFVRDGKLMASSGMGEDSSVELAPAGGNRFVVPGLPVAVEFVPAGAGRPQELHVKGPGRPRVSQLVTPFTPSAADLRAFEGTYRSAEVEGVYTLAAREGGLVMRIAGRSEVRFQPVFQDAFAGEMLGVIRFSRGAGGAVTGFLANSDGARRMPFERARD
jgi:CubicO group peptidase (beta-lactamase class C family)